jgi:hypothetical protein
MSLAQLGRFAEADAYEAETIRLADKTHHAFTIGLAYYPAHTVQTPQRATGRVRGHDWSGDRGAPGQ